MTGPIALHGGGEFLPGDERFLEALLETAARRRAQRYARAADGPDVAADDDTLDVLGHALDMPPDATSIAGAGATGPIRIVIVPTAAARGRPDAAAASGVAGFRGQAERSEGRFSVKVETARIVDAGSAADPAVIARLLAADAIYFPGGDPDLIPAILDRTPAREAIEAAWKAGATLAGASAGAMALADWTWTPHGGIRGLGFVGGLAVVPHYDDIRRTRWQAALDIVAPGGIGYLGLDERTGVIGESNGSTRRWRVAGEGAAHWYAPGATTPRIGRHGDLLELPTQGAGPR